MAAHLEIRHLSFRLGGTTILEDVSFALARGERLAILGPNGAGKTTLLRHVAGILPPPPGSVLLEGRDQGDFGSRAWARALAYLPQLHDSQAPFTAAEMVFHGRYPHLGPFDSGGRTDHEAVQGALEQTGMLELADRTFASLSGGEQQRVMIATALAQESPIILLDEPTTFLDLRHQAETARLLDRLQGDRGITLVFVTHDVNLATRLSARILALEGGRVHFDGTSAALLEPGRLERLFGTKFHRVTPGDPGSGVLPYTIPAWDLDGGVR